MSTKCKSFSVIRPGDPHAPVHYYMLKQRTTETLKLCYPILLRMNFGKKTFSPHPIALSQFVYRNEKIFVKD